MAAEMLKWRWLVIAVMEDELRIIRVRGVIKFRGMGICAVPNCMQYKYV